MNGAKVFGGLFTSASAMLIGPSQFLGILQQFGVRPLHNWHDFCSKV